jgi:hypothetical protein
MARMELSSWDDPDNPNAAMATHPLSSTTCWRTNVGSKFHTRLGVWVQILNILSSLKQKRVVCVGSFMHTVGRLTGEGPEGRKRVNELISIGFQLTERCGCHL